MAWRGATPCTATARAAAAAARRRGAAGAYRSGSRGSGSPRRAAPSRLRTRVLNPSETERLIFLAGCRVCEKRGVRRALGTMHSALRPRNSGEARGERIAAKEKPRKVRKSGQQKARSRRSAERVLRIASIALFGSGRVRDPRRGRSLDSGSKSARRALRS